MLRLLRRFRNWLLLTVLGPRRYKQRVEFAYWRGRKRHEGELRNAHFKPAYTTHFGMTDADYQGARVLDIGCGPRGSLEWATMAAECVGLDPLVPSYRTLGIEQHRMTYVASAAENMPFADAHFDIVCSFNSLDHVDDLGKSIAEIKRVVKPGGLFLLMSDIHSTPTICEPSTFDWTITERFKPEFDIIEEAHIEKTDGLYNSLNTAVPYDHANPADRYGIIRVKFRRRP